MQRHLRNRIGSVVTAFLLAVLTGAGLIAQSGAGIATAPLVVHEWGTFTSVAGPDGAAVKWRPLSGPSDLPCFVQVLQDSPKTWWPGGLPAVPATVRMETPVLYFYGQRGTEQTVDVRVSFPKGVITEWYPYATAPPRFIPKELAAGVSTIEWNGVRVTPDVPGQYLTEKAPSHYYAARDTDASPVRLFGQSEKFIFYRGLADFEPPLTAVEVKNGALRVENQGVDIPRLVWFENRSGRIGYRITAGPHGVTTIDPPELGASFDALALDLERMLTEQGLFPREARAMVATWRDSWFEEGTRLFYLLPQASVDALLPLDIRPAPARVARAFVGRLEVITTAVLADAHRAFANKDLATLNKYGRFLEPVASRLLAGQNPPDSARVTWALNLVAKSHVPEASCR